MSKPLQKLKKQAFASGICDLIEWTNKKGYSIDFDYCVQDELRPGDKMITISTRQGEEKQLYALLHECGHLILGNNETAYEKKYPSSTKMAYCNSNKNLAKTAQYKVDILAEEIDAWRKGKDLAKRLDIWIDEESYYKTMSKCVYTYVKFLAK